MNHLSDLDINCAVRKALVRHWVDLGLISVRTTRGVVWLTGTLAPLSNTDGDLNTAVVLAMLSEIRRIHGVHRVNTNLTNWIMSGDTWQLISGRTGAGLSMQEKSITSSGPVNVWVAKEKESDDTESSSVPPAND